MGWFGLACGIVNFLLSYSGMDTNKIIIPTIWEIASFTATMFLLGVFEESLSRGLILNIMLLKCGNSKKGIIEAVVLSSSIFGLAHFVNLIPNPQLIIAAVSQAIYATFIGIFFGGVYIRCRNLWSVIILHAGFDWFASILNLCSLSAAVKSDVSLVTGLTTVIICIPFLCVGLFLLRKVEPSNIYKTGTAINIK